MSKYPGTTKEQTLGSTHPVLLGKFVVSIRMFNSSAKIVPAFHVPFHCGVLPVVDASFKELPAAQHISPVYEIEGLSQPRLS